MPLLWLLDRQKPGWRERPGHRFKGNQQGKDTQVVEEVLMFSPTPAAPRASFCSPPQSSLPGHSRPHQLGETCFCGLSPELTHFHWLPRRPGFNDTAICWSFLMLQPLQGSFPNLMQGWVPRPASSTSSPDLLT